MATDRSITYKTISISKMRMDIGKNRFGRFKKSTRIFPDFVLPPQFIVLKVWFSYRLFLKKLLLCYQNGYPCQQQWLYLKSNNSVGKRHIGIFL